MRRRRARVRCREYVGIPQRSFQRLKSRWHRGTVISPLKCMFYAFQGFFAVIERKEERKKAPTAA